MYFFEKNETYRSRIFCIEEGGASYTYGQVWEMGDAAVQAAAGRELVLQLVGNDVASVSTYLALLRKRCPIILMGKHADPEHIQAMIRTYRPDHIAADGQLTRAGSCPQHAPVHPNLALLLSTSGSTGAQKLVRLTYDNLQANCDSIVTYLELTEDERPITTLPMEYTYGLSVIHSHAAVGASIILTDRPLFKTSFWEMAETYAATSMAGVPYTYEMLERLRFRRMDLPALRTMTQAGGHLNPDLQEKMAIWAEETGRRFFVMYGQTEATARMSYLPWEHCRDKKGSIGIPVPGGQIRLLDAKDQEIREAGVSGEMIYYGDNVSMGYALCREDLAKGDENGGRLRTGDMAYRDEDGYYFITGRKKRFVKLYGKRMSLDRIQEDLQEAWPEADIVCTGDDSRGVTVWWAQPAAAGEAASGAAEGTGSRTEAAGAAEGTGSRTEEAAGADLPEEDLLQLFWDRWGIRENMVSLRPIAQIPRNDSGKTLYAQLADAPDGPDHRVP